MRIVRTLLRSVALSDAGLGAVSTQYTGDEGVVLLVTWLTMWVDVVVAATDVGLHVGAKGAYQNHCVQARGTRRHAARGT